MLPGALRIEHGPLPWRPGAVLARHEINEISVEETSLVHDKSRQRWFTLSALATSGKKHTLATNIRNHDVADDLMWKLENAVNQ